MTDSIWKTLSAIDCSKHIEKKGNFSYLAWTWAWAMIKEKYPEADYVLEDDTIYPDGTMEVRVSVDIGGLHHTMWLPVLNYQNKPIANPNAFDINTSRMRCLVKCLAMFGLGHYIYAGESLPAPSPVTQEDYDKLVQLVAENDSWGLRQFTVEQGSKMDELFNLAPEGHKTRFKAQVREVYGKSNDALKATLDALEDAVSNPDAKWTVSEIISELEPLESEFVHAGMSPTLKSLVGAKLENGE